MAIKIHWGPNGSYKTSGAVMDDVIPAIKQGRTIITNIRGMSRQRCVDNLAKPGLLTRGIIVPDSFDLIYLDLDSDDGLDRCRDWFRWAPKGALIIFDETQIVFPTSWKEKDLLQFNFPGGRAEAKKADQPYDWLDAWTRHRHWNWDVVLTTPNIKYIRSDIRFTCEGAFKHANFGLLGPVVKFLLGDYKETFHDAQLNTPGSKAIAKNKRIKSQVSQLYDSTTTGTVKDTSAGTSIFASTPLVMGFVLVICALAYSIGTGGPVGFANTDKTDNKISVLPGDNEAANLPDNNLPTGYVAKIRPLKVKPKVRTAMADFLDRYQIDIQGTHNYNTNSNSIIEFRFVNPSTLPFIITSVDLLKQGVLVNHMAECMAEITYQDHFSVIAGCYKEPPEPEAVTQEPANQEVAIL